jgi:spore maturation protein CgeB
VRIVMFSHSLISDWNNRDAHFLRGVASELLARGHELRLYEPADSWSLSNLLRDRGVTAVAAYHDAYPQLNSVLYDPVEPELERLLDGADLVLVNAWNTPTLIERIAQVRARTRSFQLLFHHTPGAAERASADPDLRHYDGVLTFSAALRERYLARGSAEKVFVWREAADTRVWKPLPPQEARRDLVWIGNWGDGERSAQLQAYVVEPISALRLSADVYGVRYPEAVQRELAASGARYRGYLYNFDAPRVFAAHRVTVHVPRPQHAQTLSDLPSIRVLEALACGIPLVCAAWRDAEGMFAPGEDYLVARNPQHMAEQLRAVLNDPALAGELATRGLATVARRHTCAHRVDELLTIYSQLAAPRPRLRSLEALVG